MATNSLRFTGLASGLDTESIVNSMLQPYKAKKDTAWQQQKLMELKKDAWKEMNNNIYTFYTKTLNNARLESTFNKKNVSTSTSGVIEVGKNTGSLPDGTHTVEVKHLAEGARTDTVTIRNNAGYNKVNGKDTKISDLDNTIISDQNITIKYKVDGKEETATIVIGKDDTINSIERSLKETIGDHYNVAFDEGVGGFFISSKKTGKNEEITFSGDSKVLGAIGIGTSTKTGKNAEVNYNGIEVDSSSNTVTVNGLEMKLISEGKTTIVATRDTEDVVDFVKGFVEEYNKLIEDINKKVGANYNKDYKPLTSEQKKDMSEDDIKLWEEKINSSILRKDPVLSELVSTMRTIVTGTQVENSNGKKISLSSIGITTGSWDEKGKLHIDEDKLRKAVNEDADAIAKIFNSKKSGHTMAGLSETEYNKLKETDKKEWDKWESKALQASGIGTRLYATVTEKLKGNTDKSTNFLFNDKLLDKQIKDQKETVFKLEDKMARMENMYYKKFTAMEKMMSQLNNQSSWLSSQLGGM